VALLLVTSETATSLITGAIAPAVEGQSPAASPKFWSDLPGHPKHGTADHNGNSRGRARGDRQMDLANTPDYGVLIQSENQYSRSARTELPAQFCPMPRRRLLTQTCRQVKKKTSSQTAGSGRKHARIKSDWMVTQFPKRRRQTCREPAGSAIALTATSVPASMQKGLPVPLRERAGLSWTTPESRMTLFRIWRSSTSHLHPGSNQSCRRRADSKDDVRKCL